MSSRTVKFRKSSPSGGAHYDHQRSDSGVGSFSDCESRTSNPDPDYLVPGYDDRRSVYGLQHALETTRQERDEWMTKAAALDDSLKQIRNELEQTKARMRALANENELLGQAKDSLSQTNKDLVEQNAQLQETVKELKRANRKSSNGSSPSGSSGTASESSDEKKLRRSPSKRRGEKDKERDRERERDKDREKERERERRKEKERAEKEETERLRKRFDTRADESDAKSSSASAKSQRGRRDSYIEPLGHGAPRPQVPVPPSPSSRAYPSYGGTTAAPAYPSIREPFAGGGGAAARPMHPAVYVQDEYSGYGAVVDDDEAYRHGHATPRSSRHPR